MTPAAWSGRKLLGVVVVCLLAGVVGGGVLIWLQATAPPPRPTNRGVGAVSAGPLPILWFIGTTILALALISSWAIGRIRTARKSRQRRP